MDYIFGGCGGTGASPGGSRWWPGLKRCQRDKGEFGTFQTCTELRLESGLHSLACTLPLLLILLKMSSKSKCLRKVVIYGYM